MSGRGGELLEGRIIKGIGGIFEVYVEPGVVLTCRARGRLRLRDQAPLVGDKAQVRRLSEKEGVIEKIHPRRSVLPRPPIANVDQLVLVASLAEPPPNLELLDRILVRAADAQLRIVMAWNKADLVSEDEASRWMRPYEPTGYPCLPVSARMGTGLDALRSELAGRISTLAGASGVGKSSLLNALHEEFQREVGAVGARLKRGRHTTREVALLQLPGAGWVADTPGFSTLRLQPLTRDEVARAYPDYQMVADECRFKGCLHREEPGCAVRQRVQAGEFDAGRHRRYLVFLDEAEESEPWQAGGPAR